jgi:pilus assembly protein Flp/PilA
LLHHKVTFLAVGPGSPFFVRVFLATWAPYRRHRTTAGKAEVTWAEIMKTLFRNFLKDESAATAIEYGLIAAGISIAIISVVNGIGSNLRTKFTSISSQLR